MKCPVCQWAETSVIDSRPSRDGLSIRRRRMCNCCEQRFTTYEASANLVSPIVDPNQLKFSRHPAAKFIELVLPVLEFLEFHYPGCLQQQGLALAREVAA